MKSLVILVVLASAAHADRAASVDRALAAVRALGSEGRTRLDRQVTEAARQRCRADVEVPAVACLIEAVRGLCERDATCILAGDVIATNLRGTNELLDEPTRMRILRTSSDYRAGVAAELARRYAVLAAELVLAGEGEGKSAGDAAEGAAIDRLCVRRDRELHACAPGAVACMASLPWSRCVAALVWYVGGGR